MRKSLAVAVAAAAALAAGGSVPALVQTADASPAPLKLVSVTKKKVDLPTGFIVNDVDHNATGKAVGADAVNCTTENNGPCAVTLALKGGNLYLSATLSRSGIHGTVLAGTGKYAGASGKLTGKSVSASKTDVTVTFKKL